MNFEKLKTILGKETINGTEIVCKWDDGYQHYVLYFPQIALWDPKIKEKDIPDQLFRISEDPEIARKVFEYAKTIARETTDIADIFLGAVDFASSLREGK